ncbi:MAG: sigma 54-interacting transcriptional regulator [Acidobacteriota bacterium]
MTMCIESSSVHVIREILLDFTCALRCDSRVMITGDPNPGKRQLAELIHRGSRRAPRRFLTVDCAVAADPLLELRLFGAARASVPGPDCDIRGLLEQADGGTVFLENIGEIGPALQGRLLNFLETRQIRRVGADQAHTEVDVRLISSADARLFERAETGAFSAALYYRLNVVQLATAAANVPKPTRPSC